MVSSIFFKPKYIHLYSGDLMVKKVESYLKKKLKNIKIKIRDNFLRFHTKEKDENFVYNLAKELAKCKSIQQAENKELLQAEIEYEIRKIKNPKDKSFGNVYDGFLLSEIFCNLLSEKERNFNFLHVVFTDQLIGTYGEDKRLHLRTSIYGMPCVISIPGIVEAPAKPKEYYLVKNLGREDELIKWKKENKDKFIDYNDKRITNILNGYVMQCLFYYLIGNPFCEDKNCCLFNAHYQSELIQAHINSPYDLCKYHERILYDL